ncbi:hypothetical protein QUF49_03285 [Fictibacillus sp. b24]|nr:hypothetical protein [Fictibacillus sp. b24]MDM5315002.1 hypothetical protein [Fictibacillus sp. b24]
MKFVFWGIGAKRGVHWAKRWSIGAKQLVHGAKQKVIGAKSGLV